LYHRSGSSHPYALIGFRTRLRENSVDLVNHWDPTVEAILQPRQYHWPLVANWNCLSQPVTHLIFAVNAFAPLNGFPFVSRSSQRLLFILDRLNRFKSCFDVNGQRTPEGHEIYREFFTGRKEGGGRGRSSQIRQRMRRGSSRRR